jgi:hypothetical protein
MTPAHYAQYRRIEQEHFVQIMLDIE